MPPPPGPPPPGSSGQPPGGPPALRPDEERLWATLAHALSLVAAAVALGVLAPLLVLVVFGNRSSYVRHHATESLNFQLTALLLFFVGFLIALLTLGVGLIAIVPLALAYGLWYLIAVIIGSVRANNGELWRYPLTLRLVH